MTEQQTMKVELATKLINEVKEAIMNVVDKYGTVMADDCIETDRPVVMIHTDEFDIGGNYGCVELRVYWKEEECQNNN